MRGLGTELFEWDLRQVLGRWGLVHRVIVGVVWVTGLLGCGLGKTFIGMWSRAQFEVLSMA